MIVSNSKHWLNFPSDANSLGSDSGVKGFSNTSEIYYQNTASRRVGRYTIKTSELASGSLTLDHGPFDVVTDLPSAINGLRGCLYPVMWWENEDAEEYQFPLSATCVVSNAGPYQASISGWSRFYFIDLRQRNIIVDPDSAYTLGYGQGLDTSFYSSYSFGQMVTGSPWNLSSGGISATLTATDIEPSGKFVIAKVLNQEQADFVAGVGISWFDRANFDALDAPDADDLTAPMWAGGLLVLVPPVFHGISWELVSGPAPHPKWYLSVGYLLRPEDPSSDLNTSANPTSSFFSWFRSRTITRGMNYYADNPLADQAHPNDSVILQ